MNKKTTGAILGAILVFMFMASILVCVLESRRITKQQSVIDRAIKELKEQSRDKQRAIECAIVDYLLKR